MVLGCFFSNVFYSPKTQFFGFLVRSSGFQHCFHPTFFTWVVPSYPSHLQGFMTILPCFLGHKPPTWVTDTSLVAPAVFFLKPIFGFSAYLGLQSPPPNVTPACSLHLYSFLYLSCLVGSTPVVFFFLHGYTEICWFFFFGLLVVVLGSVYCAHGFVLCIFSLQYGFFWFYTDWQDHDDLAKRDQLLSMVSFCKDVLDYQATIILYRWNCQRTSHGSFFVSNLDNK